MLFYSSNDATSFLIDIITGTTSGPCIEGDLGKIGNIKGQ